MKKSFVAPLWALVSIGCYEVVTLPAPAADAAGGTMTGGRDASVAPVYPDATSSPDAAPPPEDAGTEDSGAPVEDAGTTTSTETLTREELRALFDQTVAPVLDAKCRTCHGPGGPGTPDFLAGAIAQHYDVILGYRSAVLGDFEKNNALVLNLITAGSHYGTSYSTGEAAAIGAWLDAEKLAASAGPIGPTPLELALAEWSGCMDFATWDQLQVAQSWAQLDSDDGPCIRCHVNGQGDFIATEESRRMFDILSTRVEYMIKYFAPNVTDPANPVIETNLPAIRAVGNGTPPFVEHPLFEAGPNSEAARALEAFYSATVARKQANQCDPPRLISAGP